MSSPPSVYITRLQAIPPSLFFMVPLATIVLFFVAISHTIVQHRHDPVLIHIQFLDSRKQRVGWVFPVVFSLALLAIVAGALLFLRGRSNAFSLVVADTIVTSFLYVELSLSVMYLLSIIADMGSVQPILFFVYCITLAAFLISGTLVSILGTFRPIPPLLAPILYLAMSVLTMPVITFSFLSTASTEGTWAPQISVASTSSYPAYGLEKSGILEDVPSSLEMSHVGLPATNATHNIPAHLLCGQISAVIHFAFTIGICILLPDQSSPQSTLTTEEVVAGIWAEALVFRIVQTAFLVLWIICTMSAFLQLFSRVNHRPPVRSSTLTTASDATAFTAIPSRSHRPKSKSISSSFSSPRPRRKPVGSREIPRRPSPPGEDCQNLHDPFASPRTSRATVPHSPTTALAADGRPTRMSAWGTLPTPIIPPRPPPNVLVINPPARRLPSLRNLRLASRVSTVPSVEDSFVHVGSPGAGSGGASLARSMSFFSYTTPSAYSQEDGFDAAFDVEEAMLAQQLLRRLDAAGGAAGGWGSSLKQLARNGSASSRRRL
ncbi:hypothetical protein B0H16DRAFT_927735 [Mycena metata]|uniref:Uncharacterized protein n=1 Tax=Mycena metata TaxID=1033252 RepID=A0AAD7N668_9AGAR|nr:hypothetical protein B0H16DRAFT_927735 [Mycena metata]